MIGTVVATVTLTTRAPAEAVWETYANPSRWPEVLPDIESACIEPDGILAPGACLLTVGRPDRNIIDMRYEVLAAEAPYMLVTRSSAMDYTAVTQYAFAPTDAANPAAGATVLVYTTVTPEKLGLRLTASIWRGKFVEQIEKSVTRRTTTLLELAERIAGVAPTPPGEPPAA